MKAEDILGVKNNGSLDVVANIKDSERLQQLLEQQKSFNNYHFKDEDPIDILKGKSLIHLLFMFRDCHNLFNYTGLSSYLEHLLSVLEADITQKSWTSCVDKADLGNPKHEQVTVDDRFFMNRRLTELLSNLNDAYKNFQIEQLKPTA